MGKRVIDKVLIRESDLWSGATREDVRLVVEALRARGWNALRVSEVGASNVEGPLRFAEDFYDITLSAVKAATERAERQARSDVTRKLIQERARLERAQTKRDHYQAEAEKITNRLEELAAAAEQFDCCASNIGVPAGD